MFWIPHVSTARFFNATADNGPNRFNREVILATVILTLIILKDGWPYPLQYPWTLSMRFVEANDIEYLLSRHTLPNTDIGRKDEDRQPLMVTQPLNAVSCVPASVYLIFSDLPGHIAVMRDLVTGESVEPSP